jgi:hypothetical protein
MRLLRGLAGALLWIVSALLGLVGVLLCVTIVLLPVGIPLLGYARRSFTMSLKMMLPRAVTHPVETTDKVVSEHGRRLRKNVADAAPDPKKVRKQTGKVRKQTGKKVRRVRKKMPLAS